jgi:hypothetical protein
MSHHRLLLAIVAAMLFIALGGTAQAGTCGDYLHIGHSADLDVGEDNLLPSQPHSKTPATPCNGPRCSNSDPSPTPMPAPSQIEIRPDRQVIAILTTNLSLESEAGCFWTLLENEYSLDLPSGVFHPPRLA